MTVCVRFIPYFYILSMTFFCVRVYVCKWIPNELLCTPSMAVLFELELIGLGSTGHRY